MPFPLSTLLVTSENLENMDSRHSLPHLMSLMKNVLLRGLNNVSHLAPIIASTDAAFPAFLVYIDQLCLTLRLNFEGDVLFFSTKNEAGLCVGDVLGVPPQSVPEWLSAGTHACQQLVSAWKANIGSYDPSSLVASIQFGEKVEAHFKTQTASIDHDLLAKSYSDEAFQDLIHDNVAWFAAQADMAFLFPLIKSHHDPKTSTHWPTVTPEGEAALPLLVSVYAGCWSFAPLNPLTGMETKWPPVC